MSVALKSSRVITVYDQYGNPLPKVIETVEMRPTSRVSSPYKSSIWEREEMQSPQRESPRKELVDNKEIFSKNIVLTQSNSKRRMVDQSVDDEDEKFRLVKKAFKRVNQTLDKGDKERKLKALGMMFNKIHSVKAIPFEKRLLIAQLELSDATMQGGPWDFKNSDIHGIVLLDNAKVNGRDCKIG